jgi:hypothetical protein
MKTILLSIALISTICIEAQTSETRTPGNFNKIQITDAVSVYYTMSDTNEIRVTGNDREISNVSTLMEGSTLIVSARGKFYNPVNVYIKGKGLNDVFVSGAGNFKTTNSLYVDSVLFSTSGASNIHATVKATKVKVLQTGASNITLSGTTETLNAELAGASNLKSYNLFAVNAHLFTTGASQAKVNVSNKLFANASGASSVKVKGNVKDISAEATTGASVARIIDDKKNIDSDSTTFNWKGKKVIVIGADKNKKDTVKKHNQQRNFDHWAGFSVGVNGLSTPAGGFKMDKPYEYLDLNYSRSFNFQLNLFQKNFHIYKNYINLVTGFGIEWRRYMLDNKTNLNPDSSFTWGVIDSTNMYSYKKNLFKSTLLQVPLLLEFNTHSKSSKSFHIAVGAIGQFLVNSKTKQELAVNGFEIEKIRKDNYNMNPFQLKAHASIGYSGFTMFGEYNVTPLFEAKKGPQVYPFVIGVRVVPFD